MAVASGEALAALSGGAEEIAGTVQDHAGERKLSVIAKPFGAESVKNAVLRLRKLEQGSGARNVVVAIVAAAHGRRAEDIAGGIQGHARIGRAAIEAIHRQEAEIVENRLGRGGAVWHQLEDGAIQCASPAGRSHAQLRTARPATMA